eukprot:IDg23644t1
MLASHLSWQALAAAAVAVCAARLLLALPALLRRRARRNRVAPAVVLVVSAGPGVQSPRALAHVNAISAHTQHIAVLVAHEPQPSGTPTVALPAPPPPPSERTLLALIRRLLAAVRLLITALECARAIHPRIVCIVLNVPPALPTLPITWLWTALRAPDAALIVDWHNTSHSILRTTRAPRRVVALAAMMERCVARLADAHWCVSAAMRTYLREWGVQAHIVRDTPPATFVGKRSEVPKEAHDLLCRVAEAKGDEGRHCFRQGETAMTCTRGAQWRAKPARLLVSSTSWTPDEDFSVLFAALRAVDARLRAGEDADSDGVETEVRLLVVITGRGPMREKFEARVKRAELRAVAVWCVWLAREDYPRLLALADVGVSLHASSSGLDLPMKVVDMLGCGLPVAALRYNCIRELVRDGQNGVLFSDAQELVAVLCVLLFDKGGERRVAAMRRAASRMYPAADRWLESWKREAL